MTLQDVGAYSFCRHCRQIVWSGDGGVSFFQSKDGTYYAHRDCMDTRALHLGYASKPTHIDSNRVLWYDTWLREHPIPHTFSATDFKVLYERVRARRR